MAGKVDYKTTAKFISSKKKKTRLPRIHANNGGKI